MSPLRSRRKPSSTDRELAAAWIAAVVHRKARCLVCGAKDKLQGHHVITQQALKALCRELRLSPAETQATLWDKRNGVAVCPTCHDRHTLAYRRIPRYLLPFGVYEFVDEMDRRTGERQPLRMRLRREYPEA